MEVHDFPDKGNINQYTFLVLAGTRDRVVPERQSRALFERATTTRKRYVSIEGADHNDPELVADHKKIEEAMRSAFRSTARRGPT